MNTIEHIWDEIKEIGFRNEVFSTLNHVVDCLHDIMCNLSPITISSITDRDWIASIDFKGLVLTIDNYTLYYI